MGDVKGVVLDKQALTMKYEWTTFLTLHDVKTRKKLFSKLFIAKIIYQCLNSVEKIIIIPRNIILL